MHLAALRCVAGHHEGLRATTGEAAKGKGKGGKGICRTGSSRKSSLIGLRRSGGQGSDREVWGGDDRDGRRGIDREGGGVGRRRSGGNRRHPSGDREAGRAG
eukprot:362655-Chlamydomonas_euryale.AAC.1